jgi:hypothetical protein
MITMDLIREGDRSGGFQDALGAPGYVRASADDTQRENAAAGRPRPDTVREWYAL